MSDAVAETKDRQRLVWSLGNYADVAMFLAPASIAVADACEIGPGTRVLDVGAGTGNLAVEAARRGADVLATDLSPHMLDLGRKRSDAEGLSIEWREADAEDLPFEDDSFDVVTSIFGAMFAPRASHTAGELLRVVKPGGVVGFTAWAADSYTGESFKLSAKYAPPAPEGVNSVAEWGDEQTARQRFEDHGAAVEIRSGEVVWDFESRDAARAFWEESAPPMVAAKMYLPPETFEEMVGEFTQLQDRFNQATGGRITIPAPFLIVLASKPQG